MCYVACLTDTAMPYADPDRQKEVMRERYRDLYKSDPKFRKEEAKRKAKHYRTSGAYRKTTIARSAKASVLRRETVAAQWANRDLTYWMIFRSKNGHIQAKGFYTLTEARAAAERLNARCKRERRIVKIVDVV
jgi:hypothetical protein